MNWSWIALGVVVVGGGLLIAADVFTGVDPGVGASVVAGLAILIAALGGTFGNYRPAQGKTLRYVAIWLAIATALALIYAYRVPLGLPVD